MPGPSLSYTGSLASWIKMYHTMDPAYSSLYRMHPLANNTLATAELNQRGLYPTGNQRADVAGPYPANIEMRRRDTEECNRRFGGCGGGCGGGCRTAGAASSACNVCCPGFKQTSWDELVGRRVCSGCTTPANEPRMADGGLGAMSSFEVQRYDANNGFGCGGCSLGWGQQIGCPQGASNCYARDSARCCTPMSRIVARSGCSALSAPGTAGTRALPYPIYNPNADDGTASLFAGYTGFGGDYAMPPRPFTPIAQGQQQGGTAAGKTTTGMSPAVQLAQSMPANQQPSSRVEPIKPASPLVQAKNANDTDARIEADALNLKRCEQALADARAVAEQARRDADALRMAANKAAANGKMSEAADKQAKAEKMSAAERQATQMTNYAQAAAAEAVKAANNGDSKAVADAANASMQAAGAAVETASAAMGAGAGSASTASSSGNAQKAGYSWQ